MLAHEIHRNGVCFSVGDETVDYLIVCSIYRFDFQFRGTSVEQNGLFGMDYHTNYFCTGDWRSRIIMESLLHPTIIS